MWPGALKRGRQAEEESGRQHGDKSKSKNPQVRCAAGEAGRRFQHGRWSQRYQSLTSPRSKPNSQDSAGQGNHQTLRQELADNTRMACPQGAPYRKLAGSARAPCEQEVGHIGARNQQDKDHRSHQDNKRRTSIS